MSGSMQEFLVQSTQKVAADIEAALLRLPEDKRSWQPTDNSRSAMDQFAEVAILTGHTADLIVSGKWSLGEDFNGFIQQKDELSKDLPAMQSMLKTNLAKLVTALQAVPADDLEKSIDMPWGPMSMAQIMAYPMWNMSYHEGQINYIGSML